MEKNAAIWLANTGNGEKAEGTVNGRTSVFNWNTNKNIDKWGYHACATSYAKLLWKLKCTGWILMKNFEQWEQETTFSISEYARWTEQHKKKIKVWWEILPIAKVERQLLQEQ